jgi:glycerate-2-kinase
MEGSFGDMIDDGAIITSYGHGVDHGLKKIRVREAGHPIPDENGIRGTEEIIRLAEAADERTLAVVLISGGGSALFVSPCDGISLAEKQEMTSLLLKAGADIREMNTVRKHLSRVKGGRLAEILHPATAFSLILSDVIGDHLDVIASGPTSPDPSTYGDALAVIKKYGLMELAPGAVVKLLADGANGVHPETPKEGSPVFRKVEILIIGSNRLALEAARMKAEKLGFEAEIIGLEISGEAREAGRLIARRALAAKTGRVGGPPLCLISGGETTVTVTGSGKGGRNMELALAFAMEVERTPGVTLLSAGTDGIDGPTDAAGAIVDGATAKAARGHGLNPENYLADNDSYNFFRKAGGLLVTGPTGTNVMDIQIAVIDG